ncbi:aldehyde ferredoxin oxidoreductase C-terminal domain-containing protein [Megalodesulfovibrio paquesii]
MTGPQPGRLAGWRGRVLHVDLTRRQWRTVSIPPTLLQAVLGGRGLAGRLLAEQALHLEEAEPPVILASAPLAAGVLPMACRAVVACVSPLTGIIRHQPVAGRLAVALLRAGLDAVVLHGRAEAPVSLRIEGEAVHFDPPAPALPCPPRAARLCIGPAARAGSPLACLLDETGRPMPGLGSGGGPGLAFARRNLSAVTIAGAHPLMVQDRAALRRVRRVLLRLIHASPALAGASGVGRHGDGAFFDLLQARGMLPGQAGETPSTCGTEPLGALAYAASGRLGCVACPTPCGRLNAQSGSQVLPDLRAMVGWTALVGLRRRETVLRASARCLALGLDAWEAAAAVAEHLEARNETVDEARLLNLLEALGRGERLDRSSHGSLRVKGMALPPMDPRGACGLALALAVGAQGPDPDACTVWHQELLRKPVAVDRFSWAGKARLVARGEDAAAVAQSLGVCSLGLAALGVEELSQALAAVTGWNVSAGELAACGAAIVNQDRALACRVGMDVSSDDLPARYFVESFSQAGGAGGFSPPALDREAFLEERGKYYRIRDWDSQGCPDVTDPGRTSSRPGGERWGSEISGSGISSGGIS